jgi:hypothetical protein
MIFIVCCVYCKRFLEAEINDKGSFTHKRYVPMEEIMARRLLGEDFEETGAVCFECVVVLDEAEAHA